MRKVFLGYALKLGLRFTQALETTAVLWTAKNHAIETAIHKIIIILFLFYLNLKIEKRNKEKLAN